jgi:hypothetical protein
MVIPAAMNIESAVDMLGNVPEVARQAQRKELVAAVGAPAAKKLGLNFPLSDQEKIAYELGLQTARAFLSGSAALVLKGVDPKQVL